jgi:hypothetical protein
MKKIAQQLLTNKASRLNADLQKMAATEAGYIPWDN